MIALDTNAIVRVIIEDDITQAEKVQKTISDVEACGSRILILSEVLIETVWVLESVYQCTRKEISMFIDNLLSSPAFYLPDSTVVRAAIRQYKTKGDFADLVIVGQAKKNHAQKLITFDKKLQRLYPNFAMET